MGIVEKREIAMMITAIMFLYFLRVHTYSVQALISTIIFKF